MPAGTIALTNNSTAVTGSGTTFTTELKANDFIVAVVGGVTYTLGVQSVNSATGVNLISAYNGPTASGVAWTAVPNAALVGITAQVAADVAKAIRGLNLDRANWQQVYSASGNITVTLPDGSTYSGPSWNSVVNSVGGKLDKSGGVMTGALTVPALEITAAAPYIDFHFSSSATDYNVRAINSADKTLTLVGEANTGMLLNVTGNITSSGTITVNQGGVNARSASPLSTPATGTESASGIFEAGYSSGLYTNVRTLFHTSVVQGSGTSAIIAIQTSASGAYTRYQFSQSGNATAPGSWINGSDERHKSNIKLVPDALRAVMSWRGCTYDKLDGGPEVGLIAQDVEKDCKEAVVTSSGVRKFSDGTKIEGFKSLNTAGVSAAYHTEAIKALFNLIELVIVSPDKALNSIDNIKRALGQTSD